MEPSKAVLKKLSFPHAGYQRDGVEQLVSLCLEHAARESSPDARRLVAQLLDLTRAHGGSAAAEPLGQAEPARGAPAIAACVAACRGILKVCREAPDLLPPRDALDALLATAASQALPAGSWAGVAGAVIELRRRELLEHFAAAPVAAGFGTGEVHCLGVLPEAHTGAADPLCALLLTRPQEWQQLLHIAEAMIDTARGKLTDTGAPAVQLLLAMWSPVLGAQLASSGAGGGDSGQSRASLQMLARVSQALAAPYGACMPPSAGDGGALSAREERSAWAARLWHLRRARGLLAAAAGAVHLAHSAAPPEDSSAAQAGAGAATASTAVDAIEMLLRALEAVHDAALAAGEEADARGVEGAAQQGTEEAELAWAVVGGLVANEAVRLALLAAHAAAREPSAALAAGCPPPAPALMPALRALQQVAVADAGLLATPCSIAALAALLRAPASWGSVAYGYIGSNVRTQVFSVVEQLLGALHAANAEQVDAAAQYPGSALQPCALHRSHICLLGAPLSACVAGDILCESEVVVAGGFSDREQHLAGPLLTMVQQICSLSTDGTLRGGRLQPQKCAKFSKSAALLARSEAQLGSGASCGGGSGASAAVHCASLCSMGGQGGPLLGSPQLDLNCLAFAICTPAADAPPLSRRWRTDTSRSLHGVAKAGAIREADDRTQSTWSATRMFEHDDDGTWEDVEKADVEHVYAGSWLHARQRRRHKRRARLQGWLSGQQQLVAEGGTGSVSECTQEPEDATLPAALAALLFDAQTEACCIEAGIPSALARLRPVRALHEGVARSLIGRALGKEARQSAGPDAAAEAERLRTLYELPRLATHAAARGPLLSMIKALRGAADQLAETAESALPSNFEPSASSLFHALALRLRCRLWLTCGRGFGQLEDTVAELLSEAEHMPTDGNALSVLPSISELRLATSACIADVCAFNAHRGTAFVSQLQRDLAFAVPADALDATLLHHKAASVVTMSLGSLASLVMEDELDFFAAFSLVVQVTADSASNPVGYFDYNKLLQCQLIVDDSTEIALKNARAVVLLAMVRFIAAGAEQVREWADEQLSGHEKDDSRPGKSANTDAVGGWEAGAWGGFALSSAMTTEQRSGIGPEAAVELPHGALGGPAGAASCRAVALLWRVALARRRTTEQAFEHLHIPAEIRAAALLGLSDFPLGMTGLLPPPIGVTVAASSAGKESGVSRIAFLLEREADHGAAESADALAVLLGHVLTAEVARRGRWAFLRTPHLSASAARGGKAETCDDSASAVAAEAAVQWVLGDDAFKAGDHAAADAAYARSVVLSEKSRQLQDSTYTQESAVASEEGTETEAIVPLDWTKVRDALQLPADSCFGLVLQQLHDATDVLAAADPEPGSLERALIMLRTLLSALAQVPSRALPAVLGPALATTVRHIAAPPAAGLVAANIRCSAFIAVSRFVSAHGSALPPLSESCALLCTPSAVMGLSLSGGLHHPWPAWQTLMETLPRLLPAAPPEIARRMFHNIANVVFSGSVPQLENLSTRQHQVLQLKLLWTLDAAATAAAAKHENAEPAGAQVESRVAASLNAELGLLVDGMADPRSHGLRVFLSTVWEDATQRRAFEWDANADDVRFGWSEPTFECEGERVAHARLMLEALAACCVRLPLSLLGLSSLATAKQGVSTDPLATWWACMLVCRIACARDKSCQPAEDLMPMLIKCRTLQVQASSGGGSLCPADGPDLIPALAVAVVARLGMAEAPKCAQGLHRWVLDCLDIAIVSMRTSGQTRDGGTSGLLRPLVLAANIAFEATMPDMSLLIGLAAGAQKHPSYGAGFELAADLGLSGRSSAAFALLPQTLPTLVALMSGSAVEENVAEQISSRLIKVQRCASDVFASETEPKLQAFLDAAVVSLQRLMYSAAPDVQTTHLERLIAWDLSSARAPLLTRPVCG